jgi:hypothetical protein
MFRGKIVWKGIVYSILMTLAKGFVSVVIYFEYFKKSWLEKLSRLRHHRTRNVAMRLIPSTQHNTPQTEPRPSGPPNAVALLLGFAMITRGEIGFLIASLSQSSGTLSLQHRDGSVLEIPGEELFLVIIWAVVLCTIVGPVAVGFIVRRLKKGHSDPRYTGWL